MKDYNWLGWLLAGVFGVLFFTKGPDRVVDDLAYELFQRKIDSLVVVKEGYMLRYDSLVREADSLRSLREVVIKIEDVEAYYHDAGFDAQCERMLLPVE